METKEFNKSEIFNFNESIEYSNSAIVSKTVIKKNSGNISLFAFDKGETEAAVEEVRKVVGSRTGLFARHIRKAMRKGLVSPPYSFETQEEEDQVLLKAFQRLQEILSGPDERLEDALIQKIYKEVPGLLPIDYFEPHDTHKQNESRS